MGERTGEITPAEINSCVREAFAGASGALCTDVGPDFAVVQLDIVASMARPGRDVSGPSQFAIADAALWFLTFGVIGRVELMSVTSHLDISFLRPAEGRTLTARADLLSAGSRSVVGSVKVWCDDREHAPSSVAKGTYVLPRS